VTTEKLFPKANSTKKITEELLQKRTVQIYSAFPWFRWTIYSAFSDFRITWFSAIDFYRLFRCRFFHRFFRCRFFHRLFRWRFLSTFPLSKNFWPWIHIFLSRAELLSQNTARIQNHSNLQLKLPKTVKSSSLNPSTTILLNLHHDFYYKLTPCTLILLQDHFRKNSPRFAHHRLFLAFSDFIPPI